MADSDSYTTQVNVEAWVQRGTFGAGTKPSATQVQNAMKLRAGEITGVLVRAGIVASPPGGGAALPTATDPQKALKDVCDLCNSLMAAGDAVLMHDSRDPANLEQAKALWAEGSKKLDDINTLAAAVRASDDIGVRTSTGTGGIAKADFTDGATVEERDKLDLFDMDQRW